MTARCRRPSTRNLSPALSADIILHSATTTKYIAGHHQDVIAGCVSGSEAWAIAPELTTGRWYSPALRRGEKRRRGECHVSEIILRDLT
uniref:Uncharacterized protein n=1 Tax=Oryza nivara TaxID=4536 RepID=A0A0E0H8Z2_ORYNI